MPCPSVGYGVWFSASAVAPQLGQAWLLSPGQAAWLTMSVQIGFVVGVLLSAILNLADRLQARHIIIGAAIGASTFNTLVILGDSYEWALVARFGTGAMLAGVYPPGMKLVGTWTQSDRGLGIGLLVGSITFGSAMPHLVNLLPTTGIAGMPPWEHVLIVTSLLSLGAAAMVLWGVHQGGVRAQATSQLFDRLWDSGLLQQEPSVVCSPVELPTAVAGPSQRL